MSKRMQLLRCTAELFILLGALFLYSCKAPKATVKQAAVISFDDFKKQHRMTSDQKCLESVVNSLDPHTRVTILFQSRAYSFNSTIVLDNFNSNISWTGQPGTIWKLGTTFLKSTALKFEYPLSHEVKRGDKHIDLLYNASKLGMVEFYSRDTVESAWGYRANDLMAVREVKNGQILFKDSLNFGYVPGRTKVTGYGPASMNFRHIIFKVDHSISHIMSLVGMETSFQDCKINYVDSPMMANGINLLDCYNIRVKNFEIRGNIDYGFLINGSRNVYFNHIQSYQCIHPLAPATFTTHVVVDSLYCDGSVIDAHPSFDVSYKNVTIVNGNGYWNCRALGVELENCDFNVKKEEHGNSLYLGMQGLTRKYEYLYDEYDIKCKNVKWVHDDYVFNGLNVYRCRDFIVENCKTHAISTGSPIETPMRRFEVIHSKVGRVYCSDSNLSVRETEFDSKLQGKGPVQPPLSCSYSGKMDIRNCTFTGYDSTYLFNYIQSFNTDILFDSCTLNQFKGFSAKTYSNQAEYAQIRFENCNLNPLAKTNFGSFKKIQYKD